MDFTSINNMNSYLKTMNMQNIWKQKAANPFNSSVQGSVSNAKEETYERASPFGDERLMSIKTKMQSGQKLSSDDMDYLREKDPATYDEVIKMERERKEFQKELGRCKTKDAARMLHLGKVTEALTAAKSGSVSAEVALAKLARMTEAYQKFTESAHYSKMAENHAELAKAIEAEKAAITGESEPAAEQDNSENMVQPEEDVHEPQDQFALSEQTPDTADNGTPTPQFTHSDKAKPVETKSPAPAPKVKTDAIPTGTKPSFVPNREAVKASNEPYTVDATIGFSHNKLNRQI